MTATDEFASHSMTALLRRASGAGDDATATPSLPADLQTRAVRRLRALALLYAVTFFLANPVSAVVSSGDEFFAGFADWAPATISIAVALVVFALCTWSRLPAATLITIGLVFEVVGSFGIAMAQYWGVYANLPNVPEHLDIAGLSWVAPWMVLFTVVVPAQPRRALIAAIASAATVPLVFALTIRYGESSFAISNSGLFAALIFMYAVAVAMAYVGARVVHQLRTDVGRAREMGSYLLQEELGQGGMGEVWRAKHRMLVRPAAIKLVRPEMLGGKDHAEQETALRRFEREAQATASMRSPNTIELYDFGITDEGTFYYVMELLQGFDLETLVERFGPVPPERAIHFLRQVCHSLAEAHASGLIHRDIKPANVYACRYGLEVDFVKVLDFGLVKSRHDGARVGDQAMTAENAVGGTPAYMAPEQVMGDGTVDGRADLYALGCVGYWLLTGQLVFLGETPMRTMFMHVQDPPVPPSERTEVAVPSSLERVIMQCLEKKPEGRPQTAEALDTALAACESAGTWTPERGQRWWATHDPA